MGHLSLIDTGSSEVFLISIGLFLILFDFLISHMKKCVKLNTKIARFPVKHVKLLVFIKIRIKLCLTKA